MGNIEHPLIIINKIKYMIKPKKFLKYILSLNIDFLLNIINKINIMKAMNAVKSKELFLK
ncbi:MAG: hypothetical protein A2015_09070 [Spirochaetes bacterium GWF1_31_7]|nr:MAG: hypothetical protein A2Y30_09150 [Spirochaetes bacterium GWE1_32_154]OHD46625.1 MAG: hypothetical protein A2Y29_07705 [Spirochaetes bacterium GWE2_31_10]OHD47639.1 MAG: hypothetical protein A2015_09070 [Spirochaetes bacterium GWF1_31_7]HBD94416.1 hypothetical protein [Spirochaetia bacterium]HBI37661.1 hypothetical protein [Spirochaetia bacterium]